jgi:hypothetical protein
MVGQDTEDAYRREVDRLNEVVRNLQEGRHTLESANLNLRAELERMRAIADENLRKANVASRDLNAFRDKVRTKAIEVAKEEGWCTEGLNQALRDLGLDPYAQKWRISLTVDVEADDEYDAKSLVEGMLDGASDVINYDIDHSVDEVD